MILALLRDLNQQGTTIFLTTHNMEEAMSIIQNAISQKTGLPPAAVGKVLEIATPMVMGYVGKIFISQKMDTKSLTNLPGDQSKMALQASPGAAAMAKQLMGAQEPRGGIEGVLKKVLGKLVLLQERSLAHYLRYPLPIPILSRSS